MARCLACEAERGAIPVDPVVIRTLRLDAEVPTESAERHMVGNIASLAHHGLASEAALHGWLPLSPQCFTRLPFPDLTPGSLYTPLALRLTNRTSLESARSAEHSGLAVAAGPDWK